MKIHRIFVIIKEQLYAVSYDGKEEDVFSETYDTWRDVEYLTDFFETHHHDLQSGFYGSITVEEAVLRTIDETEVLFDELYDLAENAKLDTLFRPLSNQDYRSYDFQKRKAYGPERKSWLRIYAIRFDDKYFITGGAIKLTQTMEERAHTKLELRKLEMVRDYLKEGQDEGEFVYLDL